LKIFAFNIVADSLYHFRMQLQVLVLFGALCLFTVNAKKDYYKTLGLKKGASSKEIKNAFRTLAKEYHPDKNPGKDTTKQFREIAEAYEVLRDEDKRRQYDAQGHNAWSGSSNTGGFKPGNFNFDDLFKDFDDDFFADLKPHFAHHFGSHKMAHEAAGGHFDLNDVNFEDLFQSPLGDHGHDSFFGRDMHMFGTADMDTFGGIKTEQKNGQTCKTVTQKVGNSVTTFTQCS